MTPHQKIEKALENLSATISQNGYTIMDVPTEDIADDQIELYRYPPDLYDMTIVAAPDTD